MKIPSKLSFLLCLLFYTSFTIYVFYLVYNIHPITYIDEQFHVFQAKNYCLFNFTHWDPKITTLPGLYVYTVGLLSPVSYLLGQDVCNLFMLRLVNVFTSILTFCLLYYSFKLIYRNYLIQHDIVLWSAFNVSSFPLLYFFNFLYYTDVVSVFFVLLSHYYHIRHRYFRSAFVGCLGILMRQTNVVWIGFLLLLNLNEYFHGIFGKIQYSTLSIKHFIEITFNKIYKRKKSFLITLFNSKYYILSCCLFILFVYFNKGIVVGDRSSHTAVIHIPQLFYFSLFCTFFSLPFAIRSIKPFIYFSMSRIRLILFLFILFIAVVHFNSIVHPYLLADNRHYTFYFWKLVQKYFILKYLLVPVYMFCIYNITYNLYHMQFCFALIFWLCTVMLVVPQKLLELRYFILPYLFYRLNLRPVYRWQLLCETLLYSVINCFVFYVFINKEFYWSDSSDIQRIGW